MPSQEQESLTKRIEHAQKLYDLYRELHQKDDSLARGGLQRCGGASEGRLSIVSLTFGGQSEGVLWLAGALGLGREGASFSSSGSEGPAAFWAMSTSI